MGPDLLLLTIYFICVFYVLYQMARDVENSIDPKVELSLKIDSLVQEVERQLDRQGRDDIEVDTVPQKAGARALMLKFFESGESSNLIGNLTLLVSPQGQQTLKPIPGLSVEVTNQKPFTQVSIDWDNSSLSLLTNQARRVVRHIPGLMMSLGQPQVHTVVNPNQKVAAVVTSEDSFGRNPDTQVLQPVTPLLDLSRVTGLPFKGNPTYSLMLLVNIYPTAAPHHILQLLIPFQFEIKELPEEPAFFLFRWLLSFSR